MGCEGGVTIYDAEVIEQHFGADVWALSGFGCEHSMPIVTLHGKRYCVTDWNTCNGREDRFQEAAYDYDRDPLSTWRFYIDDDKQEFAREVARWATGNAQLACVETWT